MSAWAWGNCVYYYKGWLIMKIHVCVVECGSSRGPYSWMRWHRHDMISLHQCIKIPDKWVKIKLKYRQLHWYLFPTGRHFGKKSDNLRIQDVTWRLPHQTFITGFIQDQINLFEIYEYRWITRFTSISHRLRIRPANCTDTVCQILVVETLRDSADILQIARRCSNVAIYDHWINGGALYVRRA